jgi:hypothetical protein
VPVYLIVRTVKAKSTPAVPVVWFVCLFASFVVANVTATPGPVTMDSHKVESQLARAVRAQYGVRVDVSCPANPVVPVGDNFSCDVTAPVDGSTASVYVTVTDSDGRYTWVLTQ